MKKEIFIVVEDSAIDYEGGTEVQAFDTHKKAVACVADLKKEYSENCAADGMVLIYESEDEFLFQEYGNYARNHYLVSVWKRELK